MRRVAIAVAGVAVALAGCAKSPESIAPAYVSERTYEDYSCSDLTEERTRVQAALTTASDQQSQARTNDTVGVIFLGLPVSTLSGGNVAYQVADLKGQLKAIDQSSIKKKCSSSGRSTERVATADRDVRPVAASYSPLPEGMTPPYEGVQLSSYSASDMRWFCAQQWESRVSPAGRTEMNPCHKPEAFRQ